MLAEETDLRRGEAARPLDDGPTARLVPRQAASLLDSQPGRDGDSRVMGALVRPRRVRGFALVGIVGLLVPCGAGEVCAQETAVQEPVNQTLQSTGDVGQYVPTVVGLALIAARHDHRGLVQDALATAATLAVVHTLKPTINRMRPNGGSRSFPSGHTAMAFAGAGFLQRRYGWTWGLPAYALGAFVGYTRVETHEHYTSDCIAGGAIGVAANLAFTHRWHGRHVALTPLVQGRGVGLALSATW